MHMVDFVYDDKRLSDYGMIIGYLSTSSNDTISLGSELIYETVKNNSNFKNNLIRINYEEKEPVSFDVFKNPCSNVKYFSDSEISFIMSWLNKKKYTKLFPIYDDESYQNIYFNGYFNISAIFLEHNVVGFTLTFIQDSPFGYENNEVLSFSLSGLDSYTFTNDSDEFGYLYPYLVTVKCKASGNLTISNNLDNKVVTIKNCENGEIITLYSENKIIASNRSHLSLFNDFNYNFPRFIASDNNRQNIIRASLPCDISIHYSFIRKAGIIV